MVEASGSLGSEGPGAVKQEEEQGVVRLEERQCEDSTLSQGSSCSSQLTLLRVWTRCLEQQPPAPIRVRSSRMVLCSAMMVLSERETLTVCKHGLHLNAPCWQNWSQDILASFTYSGRRHSTRVGETQDVQKRNNRFKLKTSRDD